MSLQRSHNVSIQLFILFRWTRIYFEREFTLFWKTNCFDLLQRLCLTVSRFTVLGFYHCEFRLQVGQIFI